VAANEGEGWASENSKSALRVVKKKEMVNLLESAPWNVPRFD
jgi:hypothetical protein